MRRAVVAVGLVARADAYPGAHGRRAQARHVLREHADPAGQDGTTHDRVAVLPDGLLAARLTRADERKVQRHVRRRPARRAPSDAAASSAPSSITACSDSLPRGSISPISTWTFCPMDSTSSTFSTRLPPTRRRICEMCSRPSLPGRERDERTERRGLDDRADEALADLGHVRVGDRVDRRTRGLRRRTVGGADVDRAVVLDRDVGAGLLLDLVDHLALRPDDLADLVDRDLHRDDARCERAHLVGHVDRLGDDVEDRQASLLGLGQRAAEHRGGDAVELGVELDGRDELAGAGDLEVHVTERVLGAEDVGQRRVAGLTVHRVGHQAHGDARDGRAQRHTGVEQRQGRRADRAHRRRAVGAQRLGDLADRVGELLAARQDRHERALGERAVADLATLRRTDATRLTGASTAGSCSCACSACASPGRACRAAAPCAACSAW